MSHCRRWKKACASMPAALVLVLGTTAVSAQDTPVAPAPSPSPTPAAVATPEEPEAKPAAIEILGFVDTYYGFDFNRPNGDVQLRNFDTKHNQLSFGLLEVALEEKPTAKSRLGFRADLDYGPTTDIVHAA